MRMHAYYYVSNIFYNYVCVCVCARARVCMYVICVYASVYIMCCINIRRALLVKLNDNRIIFLN